MAKVCVILKNTLNADMGASSKFFNALANHGYSFDEVRILSQNDVQSVDKLLKEFNAKDLSVFLLDEDAINGLKSTSMPARKLSFQSYLDGFDGTVYEFNGNSIENELVELLKARELKISVAESFTGGGVARRITSVSGASAVYFEGLNTYNEQSKIKRLGVLKQTLDEYGAVSKETAYEMVCGLLNTGDCDVAITTTGLAGPGSDASGKLVGLCYLGVGIKNEVCVYEYLFKGNRQEITEQAINRILEHTCRLLQNL